MGKINIKGGDLIKNRKVLNIALAIVSVLTIGIVVAYAALSATLNISFSGVTQNALTWNVGFTGSSATGTAAGTSATGRSCGTATITSSTVSVAATTLSKPDDKCTYTLTIKNSGGIAAKLSSITPTKPSSITCGTASGATMVCGNITYKLTSDSAGNTALATNTTLNAGGSLTVYLVASYTGTSLNSTAVTQSGAKFVLSYAQA